MDARRLTEIRERLAKRTQGEWFIGPDVLKEVFNGCTCIVSEHIDDAIICAMGHDVPGDEANAEFIAHAPADIRDLLEHVEKLEAGLQAIAEWKFNWRGDCVAEAKQVAESALKGGN